jgi:TonB family protein
VSARFTSGKTQRRIRRAPHNAAHRALYARAMRYRNALGALALLAASACSTYGDTADNPIRIVRPTRQEIMRVYPREALAQGISGRATVECEIITGGQLDHCRVVTEDPEGKGFGDAAIQLAFEHTVRPDANGYMPVGRRVDLPVQFTPPR